MGNFFSFSPDFSNFFIVTFMKSIGDRYNPYCIRKKTQLKSTKQLHKSPLLIANIIKGAVPGLRHFFATESP